MCLIPVGTLQRETLWSMKGGVLPGAEAEQPLQMFLDTRQDLYKMQTPSLSQNFTEKCPWTYRGCRFCEGGFCAFSNMLLLWMGWRISQLSGSVYGPAS